MSFLRPCWALRKFDTRAADVFGRDVRRLRPREHGTEARLSLQERMNAA
jgi:hypothetical protein